MQATRVAQLSQTVLTGRLATGIFFKASSDVLLGYYSSHCNLFLLGNQGKEGHVKGSLSSSLFLMEENCVGRENSPCINEGTGNPLAQKSRESPPPPLYACYLMTVPNHDKLAMRNTLLSGSSAELAGTQ
eukprot:scaffold122063_cov17-Tisochrysis_lutea.AAC.3